MLLCGLSLGAYFFLFARQASDAVHGSRTAYLVVAPVLAAMIATSYRTAPRGVEDAESDWIIGALVGGGGLTGVALLTHRLPALAGLWKLDLVGVVIWAASAAMVIFGVRYVVRMWQLWLFALWGATPLPYLLVLAAVGGSDTAAGILAAALGAAAVFLSVSSAPMKWRLSGALISMALSSVAVLALQRTGLLVIVIVAAGVIPGLTTVYFHRFNTPLPATHATAAYPHRGPLSLVALVLAASTILVMHPPARPEPRPALARADWIERAGLHPSTQFPFISRYLGPAATLTRFDVAPAAGLPTAAVDVMTTPNLAALHDFADAVWYPASSPVEYGPAYPIGAGTTEARTVHSNADVATTGGAQEWYAVVWVWRTVSGYQQVTVVVNQAVLAPDDPALPQPVSLRETVFQPAVWIGRQQEAGFGAVDKHVLTRAEQVVAQLIAAGDPISA